MSCLNSNQPKDISQNTKQNNGSLVERYENIKALVGFMNLDIPNRISGESNPRAHTPSIDASFTYHTVSFTP